MYLAFTRTSSESYCRRLRSLVLCLCDVFRELIYSLACSFYKSALDLVLFQVFPPSKAQQSRGATSQPVCGTHWLRGRPSRRRLLRKNYQYKALVIFYIIFKIVVICVCVCGGWGGGWGGVCMCVLFRVKWTDAASNEWIRIIKPNMVPGSS